jgi:hypothetical protein
MHIRNSGTIVQNGFDFSRNSEPMQLMPVRAIVFGQDCSLKSV